MNAGNPMSVGSATKTLTGTTGMILVNTAKIQIIWIAGKTVGSTHVRNQDTVTGDLVLTAGIIWRTHVNGNAP